MGVALAGWLQHLVLEFHLFKIHLRQARRSLLLGLKVYHLPLIQIPIIKLPEEQLVVVATVITALLIFLAVFFGLPHLLHYRSQGKFDDLPDFSILNNLLILFFLQSFVQSPHEINEFI